MSTFAFLVLCIQVTLIQNVYSQCYSGAFVPGYSSPNAYALDANLGGWSADVFGAPAAAAGPGAYGGSGVGDVAVAGQMGVAGTTLVAGQVPILGAVEFGGIVPAAGAVSIAGSCGCGRGAYVY